MPQIEWKLVPAEPTEEMLDAANEGDRAYTLRNFGDIRTVMQGPYDHWAAMLDAAPEPPHLSMTKEEVAIFQDWKGMDGAIAFHLIQRHADDWGDVARMMEAWLAANVASSNIKIGAEKHQPNPQSKSA